jgi:hypothetical protein
MPDLGEILFFCVCVLAVIAGAQRIYRAVSRHTRLRVEDKARAFLREGKGVLRSVGLSADGDEGGADGTDEEGAVSAGREGPPTDDSKES